MVVRINLIKNTTETRSPPVRIAINKSKNKDMKDHETPKPGSPEYPVNRPQDLTQPKFRSDGQNGDTDGLPPVENLNDQERETEIDSAAGSSRPRTDLGNDRDEDEEDRERIIRR